MSLVKVTELPVPDNVADNAYILGTQFNGEDKPTLFRLPLDGIRDEITPTIGENGNWFLGNTDTGKPSQGETYAPDDVYTKTEVDRLEYNGGNTNIATSTVKGNNNNGVIKAYQISGCTLVVMETHSDGTLSISGEITSIYDITDPQNPAKGTYTYQGVEYQILNVGDQVLVRNTLNLADNENIYLKLVMDGDIDDIEVGMQYNHCYPTLAQPIRYGKVVYINTATNCIYIDNIVTGIDRYFKLRGIPDYEARGYFGGFVIGGGYTGHYEIAEAEGLSLHVAGDQCICTLGGSARGYKNEVNQFAASADGQENVVDSYGGSARGVGNKVKGDIAIADGENNEVDGYASYSQNSANTVKGNYSSGSGFNNSVEADYADGGGNSTDTKADYGFTRGYRTKTQGNGAVATGVLTEATSSYAKSSNYKTKATGQASSANNQETQANGTASFATGYKTKADGNYSFTSGIGTQANGEAQAVLGKYNVVDLEGRYLLVVGNGTGESNRHNAFAIDKTGQIFTVNNIYMNNHKVAIDSDLIKNLKDGTGSLSVTFGSGASATGDNSIAGGINSEANGRRTISVGQWTLANSDHQAVFGTFNIPDEHGLYRLIVGNGRADNLRANAFTVDKNGNGWFGGELTVGDDRREVVALNAQGKIPSSYLPSELIPTIGENGNWFFGDTDTGKPSQGVEGQQGVIGPRGYSGLVPLSHINYSSELEAAANTKSDIGQLEGAVTISLGEGVEGYDNEWCFTVTQGQTAYDVALPVISWQLGIAPTFAANTTTEVRLYYIGDTLKGVWSV